MAEAWRERMHNAIGRVAMGTAGLFRGRISLGVRLAAFDMAGRVFLVRHSYLPGLHLPGGGVDPGESCREAVVREAWEEGRLEVAALEQLGVYWNHALGGRDHVVLFRSRRARQIEPAPLGLEITEAGFFDPFSLPPDTSPATRRRLAELAGDASPDEIW